MTPSEALDQVQRIYDNLDCCNHCDECPHCVFCDVLCHACNELGEQLSTIKDS